MPSPDDTGPYLDYARFVRLGVHKETFQRLRDFGGATPIAQYYGLVQQGLIYADIAHLFRGVNRPLMDGDNEEADKHILIYSWVPQCDWEWDRSTSRPVRRSPPANRVFAVQARQYVTPDEHGAVGAVLHWSWIAEDRVLRAAPVNWDSRYTEKIWTKLKK